MNFYPLTLSLHLDGILMASISPLDRLSHLQSQAESMLGKLLTSLYYLVVMAMECFTIGDELMMNELAVIGSELYCYGKEVRPGRKVGHVNLCMGSADELRISVSALEKLFSEPYPKVFAWLDKNLLS